MAPETRKDLSTAFLPLVLAYGLLTVDFVEDPFADSHCLWIVFIAKKVLDKMVCCCFLKLVEVMFVPKCVQSTSLNFYLSNSSL